MPCEEWTVQGERDRGLWIFGILRVFSAAGSPAHHGGYSPLFSESSIFSGVPILVLIIFQDRVLTLKQNSPISSPVAF